MRQAYTTGREIAVAGTFNFRELGGMRTRGSASVRQGLLYRSGDLGRLEPEGVRRLQDLGVASVLDLRTTAEIAGRGAIAEEYALSEAGLAGVGTWADRDPETAAWLARIPPRILEARPATMLAFLRWLREEHGSIEEFAQQAGAGAPARLRARLLEPR